MMFLDSSIIDRIQEEEQNYRDLLRRKEETDRDVVRLQKEVEDIQVVQKLILTAAKQTQEAIEVEITKLISQALQAIFDDPYEFKITFVERRNQLEADLSLIRNGEEFDIMNDCGGGVVDVVSMVLRVCAILLSGRRRILIADEPGRMISAEYQIRMSEFLQRLGKELGMQIIIVTHSEAFSECADSIYRVENGTVQKVR